LGYASPMYSGKIFGVGLGRTGTKSLTLALRRLGYDIVHYPLDTDTVRRVLNGQAPLGAANSHDGITDDTTVPYFEEFASRYPDSKFIHTSRDLESWLQSMKSHWTKPPRRDERLQEFRMCLRNQVYGCTFYDEPQLRRAYRDHKSRVESFFREQRHRLLDLNIIDGEGWVELARFLGLTPPDEPFPHKG
jgi:hypothetical protein